MAELDYAFLAEYATVQGTKLTAVGASFTHVTVPGFPGVMRLFVAGRFRATVDEADVPISVRLVSPAPGIDIQLEGTLDPGPNLRPYNGKLGLLFAVEIPVQLSSEGLYEVYVGTDGTDGNERRLAFAVEARQ